MGLGFRVQGSGFGFGFAVKDVGFKVWISGESRVQGLGIILIGFRV